MFDVGDDLARDAERWADRLAGVFIARMGPRPSMHALDVGAGTGALTEPLVDALGIDAVAAIEPSRSSAAVLCERLPGLDVRQGPADSLPFPDGAFGLVAAQLVIHLLADPVAALAEMARVAAPHGHVAATVWDFAGSRAPLSLFWSTARELDPDAVDESGLPGTERGGLERLFAEAGLTAVESGALTVHLPYDDPDHWWRPFLHGRGPAAAYVAGLEDAHREALRRRCAERLRNGPGVIEATAWLAVATI